MLEYHADRPVKIIVDSVCGLGDIMTLTGGAKTYVNNRLNKV